MTAALTEMQREMVLQAARAFVHESERRGATRDSVRFAEERLVRAVHAYERALRLGGVDPSAP